MRFLECVHIRSKYSEDIVQIKTIGLMNNIYLVIIKIIISSIGGVYWCSILKFYVPSNRTYKLNSQKPIFTELLEARSLHLHIARNTLFSNRINQ